MEQLEHVIQYSHPIECNLHRLYSFFNDEAAINDSPGPVAVFDAIPMSPRSIYLKWKRPINANGILTGYHIYLTNRGTKKNLLPFTIRLQKFLTPGSPALTQIGEGTPFSVEGKTEYNSKMPDPPNIIWYPLPHIGGKAAIKVIWMPDDEEHLGDEFFLAYREEGQKQWVQVEPERVWDQIVLRNLKSSTRYAVRTVVIDGEFARRSNLLIVKTTGPEGDLSTELSKQADLANGTFTYANKTIN
uniref:Fibronectin type-III domain-containing protein n=1 Tax=Strigamia maritima TaxID=126957 RepID=T1J218_STRMM